MARSGQTGRRRPLTIRFDNEEVVFRGLSPELEALREKSRKLTIDPEGVKPLLLLDVDGALCPVNRHAPGFTLNEQLGVMVGERHQEWLARLSALYEIGWATLWEHRANTELAPVFGLEMLPVVEFDPADDDGVWDDDLERFLGATFKLKAIARAAGSRPLAWVDDEIGEDAHRWARERDLAGIPTLFLQTRTEQGLTEADVERLVAFAGRCR